MHQACCECQTVQPGRCQASSTSCTTGSRGAGARQSVGAGRCKEAGAGAAAHCDQHAATHQVWRLQVPVHDGRRTRVQVQHPFGCIQRAAGERAQARMWCVDGDDSREEAWSQLASQTKAQAHPPAVRSPKGQEQQHQRRRGGGGGGGSGGSAHDEAAAPGERGGGARLAAPRAGQDVRQRAAGAILGDLFNLVGQNERLGGCSKEDAKTGKSCEGRVQ